MTRCPYCKISTFNDLDEVTVHLNIVNAQGDNICKGLSTPPLDPHKAEPLFPLKILGRKYPAKSHDGTFMMYGRNGKISETKLVGYLLS